MGWLDKRRESDLRKIRARTLYDFEVECREQGWGEPRLRLRRAARLVQVDRGPLRLLARARRLGALEEEGSN